ncbi:uncharacterized protein C4orf51 homolog isoform X2 [Tamandua tetradactyla]|uniref:uncharacterized protein C4orf51 homolog isoform X2 n=1 Tax=Tamandua tetradactyla TaxID=48850 RepID=UPI0040541FBF
MSLRVATTAMSHYFYLAPRVPLPFSPLTSQEFDLIRHRAAASWQNETRWSDSSVTTYTGSYRQKQWDGPCKEGPSAPECQQESRPNSSAYHPTFLRAHTRGTTDVKGLFPHINSSFGGSHDVRHGVVHQILFGEFSHAPPNHEKSYMRTKKPSSRNPMKYNLKRNDFLRNRCCSVKRPCSLLVATKWSQLAADTSYKPRPRVLA